MTRGGADLLPIRSGLTDVSRIAPPAARPCSAPPRACAAGSAATAKRRPRHRGAGPALARPARRARLWFGDDLARPADGGRLGPGRGRAARCRRLPAIPPRRQPLGQSLGTRRDAARARRQRLEPRAGAARRGAARRSVLRLYPVQRDCGGSARRGAGDARRRGGRVRCGGGRGDDRAGERGAARPAVACRRGVLWQQHRARGVGERLARCRRWVRQSLGQVRAGRRVLHYARQPDHRGERARALSRLVGRAARGRADRRRDRDPGARPAVSRHSHAALRGRGQQFAGQ